MVPLPERNGSWGIARLTKPAEEELNGKVRSKLNTTYKGVQQL